ncbi:MAG: hypothetical protein V4560_05805 [Bacteroidota bacterium]
MKRSILYGKYLVAILVIVLIFQTGCKKESGYYQSAPVINTSNLTTYDYLKSKAGVYDSLLFLVDKFGIKKTLTDSAVTLFAPSNSSFQIAIQNLNQARAKVGQTPIYLAQIAAGGVQVTNSRLKPKAIRDSAQLDTMTSMYIIRKLFYAEDFAIGDGQTVFSVRGGYPMHGQRIFADAEGFQGGGSEVIQFANTKRSLFIARWSTTTTSSVNIKTKNGIVHLLRGDFGFGFDQFVSRLTLIPPPPVIYDLKNDIMFPWWPPASGYTDGQVSAGEVFKRALDGSVLTKFISFVNPSSNYYPTFYWIPKVPKICNAYSMTTANDSKGYRERDPRAWVLQATMDPNPGTVTPGLANVASSGIPNPTAVWVTIDSRQDQDWTTNYQQKIFFFSNTTAYTGYRITFLQVGTGQTNSNLIQLSEWTMNYNAQ